MVLAGAVTALRRFGLNVWFEGVSVSVSAIFVTISTLRGGHCLNFRIRGFGSVVRCSLKKKHTICSCYLLHCTTHLVESREMCE